MTEKISFGWKTINNHVAKLCQEIKNSGVEYKSVVGIQRGGLNLSQPLAECLGVKHRSVKVSFYDGDKKRDEPIVDIFDLDVNARPFVIADDLIDSGATIKYFIEKYNLQHGKDYRIAVIHWNKSNEAGLTPDHYAEEKPDAWVEYPWEAQ
jgi:hypoxanthine phosphoribosyltransferase